MTHRQDFWKSLFLALWWAVATTIAWPWGLISTKGQLPTLKRYLLLNIGHSNEKFSHWETTEWTIHMGPHGPYICRWVAVRMDGILEAYLTTSTRPLSGVRWSSINSRPVSMTQPYSLITTHSHRCSGLRISCALDSGVTLFKCLVLRSTIREMSYSAYNTLPSTHTFSVWGQHSVE